jgi:hypothetical protein
VAPWLSARSCAGEAITLASARSRHQTRQGVDTKALASELASAVEGDVRFDAGTQAMYAVDASNYRQVPLGVVVPRSAWASDPNRGGAHAAGHGWLRPRLRWDCAPPRR